MSPLCIDIEATDHNSEIRLGGLQKLDYQSVAAIGPTSPPNDFGLVAVVDGKTLKVTPMRLANVPPPMALYELDLGSNAVDVAITTKNGVTILGVLHQDEVSMYEFCLTKKPPKAPERKWLAKIPSNQSWSSATSSFALNQQISFDQFGKVLIRQNSTNGNSFLVLETDNEIQHFTTRPFNDETGLSDSGIQIRVDDGLITHGETIFSSKPKFSLLSNGRLFADKRQLASNCTSLLVTPAHLIFTTTQHLLKFVHMTEVESLEVPPDTPEVDERCRSVERGAKLVTVMPSIFALVMQMPRGNLETIYPRALVLAGIRENINAKKYNIAFLACRNQRVDMNILHDYSPKTFISDAELFIDQVYKVEYIDLFLSQLR